MKYLVSVVLVFVLVGIAEAGTKQGDTEISLATSWMRINMGDMLGNVSVDVVVPAFGVGHFFTKELELGFTATGTWMGLADIDIGAYMIGGNLKYHILTDGPLVPYAGIQVCYADAEVAVTSTGYNVHGLMWGPVGGVKFFVSEGSSIFVEYQYQMYSGEIHDVFEGGY